MATSNLASLKLTSAKKPSQIPLIQFRRNKLSKRIWEQIQLAKAQQEGTQFVITQSRTITDPETGASRTVEQPKRIKPWWFVTDNGKLALTVRYGSKVMELVKGKSAVEVASVEHLVPTLEVIKAAVEAGELDSALEVASEALREGFARQ